MPSHSAGPGIWLSVWRFRAWLTACINEQRRFWRDCADMTIWAASWQNQQNDCAPSEDSDQPRRRPRLIWVFAGCRCHFVGFVMRWLQLKHGKDFRQAFVKQWNVIPSDFWNKTSLSWVLGREGYTHHIVFVTFSFRSSLVRRKNYDVIPMERSRKWA